MLQRFLSCLLLVIFLVSPFQLPAAQAFAPSQAQVPGSGRSEHDDPWTVKQEREMEKKRNLQRQEEIKRDSEKLLELATELKQYVDKSNENTLSMDVIKKAEEIERLAKNVKQKMKGPN